MSKENTNAILYKDDAPRVDIGLITLIPEAERDIYLASLVETPEEDDSDD